MQTDIFAIDLGRYSQVWPIQEVDMKQAISEQFANVNTHQINDRLLISAKGFGDHLPYSTLKKATKTATSYVDPSIALNKDIIVNGQLIYKKDTRVNPLDYVRPRTNLFFFNGQDQEQVRFAKILIKNKPYTIQLVMIDGNPLRLARKINKPVYYAYPKVLNRFHIQSIPTLLGVGVKQYKNYLALTTLAKPYRLSTINACWFGCPKKQAALN